MKKDRLTKLPNRTFEQIRRESDDGIEFWMARDLAKVLEYSEFRHFLPVIEKAQEACRNSGQYIEDHFEEILAMVEIGSGAKREVKDFCLSRYACYLIVQNADPSKEIVAQGQTYFAIQTRRPAPFPPAYPQDPAGEGFFRVDLQLQRNRSAAKGKVFSALVVFVVAVTLSSF